jgi:hypothetical protein
LRDCGRILAGNANTLDSCASGLAFTAKLELDTTDKLLLQTLSGNGSRTVLTAGTADEATYALEDRQHIDNGVFTRSEVRALHVAHKDHCTSACCSQSRLDLLEISDGDLRLAEIGPFEIPTLIDCLFAS